MTVISTIFWGIVAFGILVLVHEFGHFIFARAFGVRVTEFMFGLPGPSVGVNIKGTRFGVTAIPLGGYNRICGMEGGEEDPNLEQVLAYVYRHGTADAEHVARTYNISTEDADYALYVLDEWGSINKPGRCNKLGAYAAPATAEHALGEPREVEDPKALLNAERAQTYRALPTWKRLVVLFAGPVFNILLALVLFVAVYSVIGYQTASTTLADVVEGQPAATAGMQAGDTITAINGVETPDYSSLYEQLSGLEEGKKAAVSYVRDGQAYECTLTPTTNDDGRIMLGVYLGTTTVHLSVADSLSASWNYLVLTVDSYAKLFNPVTTAETVSQSTSIVGIAVLTERAASAGVQQFMFLLGVISLSLGIVNLVPLPPLDGGKIVVECIERIRRRPISVRVVNAVSVAAICLFMALFVVLLNQDIQNFVLGQM